MELLYRARGTPSHLGVLAGAFNPVTVAHLALARAALTRVDQVVFVLPRRFPHKEYSGPGLEERAALLIEVATGSAGCSVACADGGLFIDIARECRAAFAGNVRVSMLCGRDAAERIMTWDYGASGAIDGMLAEFSLLVAARGGEYAAPLRFADAIGRLEVSGEFDQVSSSEVRRRIAAGEPWEHLVPAGVRERVRRLYC